MKLLDVYKKFDVTPIKAKDVYVYDDQEREFLDLYGGHGVISIGHSNPNYVKNITNQLNQIAFYSNLVENPLQEKLADMLTKFSNCDDYKLFLCSTGAEANENALKLASFQNNRSKVVAFQKSFHGRTSAAVAVTDNDKITAPINAQHNVTFINANLAEVEKELSNNDVSAVIIEIIQGIGGLNECNTDFYEGLRKLCYKYNTVLIVDEVQSGFGRTGDFFAFQKHNIQPDIISMAKGMGNGFPIGGILAHPNIKVDYGMLGTTFGGNHLACIASLSVIEEMENLNLMQNAKEVGDYFKKKINKIKSNPTLKGRGLMLGLEFDFEISNLRKALIFKHHIFTGNSTNSNLLRILPPLTIKKKHIDQFIDALNIELGNN